MLQLVCDTEINPWKSERPILGTDMQRTVYYGVCVIEEILYKLQI